MTLLVLTLSAALARAQASAPTVAALKDQMMTATEDSVRSAAADQMSRTAPTSAQDVAALFDLFSRYANPDLRKIVMASLALIPRDSPQLEPLFVTYLKQPEPEAQLFGINGAFRLRSRRALPLIRKIAERRFGAASAEETSVLSARNEWWTQYEALQALAQWQGEKVLPLLHKKTSESPRVARLLGQYFWRQTMPDLRRWATSDDPLDQQKAVEVATASIEPVDARATRDQMLELLRDPKADFELRHRLALKVGLSSTADEVDALIREHESAPDQKTRDLWAAAIFITRNPKAVPLLARYARDSSGDAVRASARAQLVDMLGEDKTRELLGEGKRVKK